MNIKNFFIFIFIFILSLNLFSQTERYSVEKINIYTYPLNIHVSDYKRMTPNYIRVNAKFFISSNDELFNSKIYQCFKEIEREEFSECRYDEFINCRVIIDFIDNSQVMTSIIINGGFWFIQDESTTIVKVYKIDEKFKKIVSELFGFALDPSIIDDYIDN